MSTASEKNRERNPLFYVAALVCGTIFGFGLTVSGMINPAKVLNFLDVTGQWDPTLACVFLGALAIALPAYQWAGRSAQGPLAGDEFKLPDNDSITPSLIGGAAIFGVGWGLAGLCPGPGLASLATLLPSAITFVAGLYAGAALYRFGSGD